MSVRKAKAQGGGPDRKANDVNRRLRMTVNWLYSICWVLGCPAGHLAAQRQ